MANKYWDLVWDKVDVEVKIEGKVKTQKEDRVVGIVGLKVEKDTRLEKFKFNIIRQKGRETKREILLITAFYGGDVYGTLVTGIGKIYSDITKLYDIGINMKRKEFVELAKIIDDNFYNLMLEEKEYIGNSVPETVLYEIVNYFKDYIKKNKVENKNGCYNIPVIEFNKEYNNSLLKGKADIREVKEALKLYGYTECNANQCTHNIKSAEDGKKTVKCISFIVDRLEEKE